MRTNQATRVELKDDPKLLTWLFLTKRSSASQAIKMVDCMQSLGDSPPARGNIHLIPYTQVPADSVHFIDASQPMNVTMTAPEAAYAHASA